MVPRRHTRTDFARRLGAVSLTVLGCCFVFTNPRGASAHPFVVDQENTVFTTTGYVFGGPLATKTVGQGFTPALRALESVEFQMNSQNFVAGTAFLRIRSGDITGTILGVSGTLVVPGVNWPPTLMHFDFAAPVPLTPGALYVIQVVAATGYLGIFASGDNNDVYPGGMSYYGATAVPEKDLWFREGAAATTPTVPETWGGVKARYR
jgi:hypothetical protein